MPRYQNGLIALNELTQFDSGNGQHWGPAATRERWYRLRQNVKNKYGVTLAITPGWNVFRPLHIQQEARTNACRQGNCNAAAVPGYSSHGGTWASRVHTNGQWVDAFAIDVGNWYLIGKDNFYAEARAVGFLAGAITPAIAGIDEPWHIIDLAPFEMPSGGDSKPFPDPEEEDEEMKMKGAYYVRKSDNATVFMLFNEVSGFYVEHSGVSGGYNNSIATSWDTNSWVSITESHANVIKAALDKVRKGV